LGEFDDEAFVALRDFTLEAVRDIGRLLSETFPGNESTDLDSMARLLEIRENNATTAEGWIQLNQHSLILCLV
jgi:hypothetical protein